MPVAAVLPAPSVYFKQARAFGVPCRLHPSPVSMGSGKWMYFVLAGTRADLFGGVMFWRESSLGSGKRMCYVLAGTWV